MSADADNVTLGLEGTEAPRSIPCFLCNDPVEIRRDKRGKLYFICESCGIQAFVRRKSGISRLENLIGEIQKNVTDGLKIAAITSHLRFLQTEKYKLESRQWIFGLGDPDKLFKEAEIKISEEIQRIKTILDNYKTTEIK